MNDRSVLIEIKITPRVNEIDSERVEKTISKNSRKDEYQ